MKFSLPVIATSGKYSFDSDAQAFINAAALTDAGQIRAIHNMVLALKRQSLWSKMVAIYPIIGGTAASHKWNLKNTATFQIQWSGGLTHASTGIVSNGTTGYGDTQIVPSTSLSQNDVHMTFYARNINTGESGAGQMGFGSHTVANSLCMALYWSGSGQLSCVNNSGAAFATFGIAGLNSLSRTVSTEFKNYQNASLIDTIAFASTGITSNSLYLFGSNNGSGGFQLAPSVDECAFASVGTGLTATDITNLYNIVQAYQTNLGRQV